MHCAVQARPQARMAGTDCVWAREGSRMNSSSLLGAGLDRQLGTRPRRAGRLSKRSVLRPGEQSGTVGGLYDGLL